jgi:MFS family permease
MTAAQSSKHLPLNYWKLWGASFISNTGNGVTAIAFPVARFSADALTSHHLDRRFNEPIALAPFTLPAGVITDRLDRKKIIIATDLLRGAVTALATFVLIFHRNDFVHVKNPLGA